MVVLNFETARRRSRRAFAGLVLGASAVIFVATVVAGTHWQSISSFAKHTMRTVTDVVLELATSDPTVHAPEIDAHPEGNIPEEIRLIPEPRQRVGQAFTICSGSKRVTCIVDGDTFWLNGEKIRIADIDTPEIGTPQCARELALGQKAKMRLQVLLSAGPFDMHALPDKEADQYGRSLRILMRNGQSIGDKLVAEGLARTWDGRRLPWC